MSLFAFPASRAFCIFSGVVQLSYVEYQRAWSLFGGEGAEIECLSRRAGQCMLACSSSGNRRERDLARYPVQGMARDLRRAAFVLPGRRQVSAGEDTMGQPFMARDALRQLARADDLVDSGRG